MRVLNNKRPLSGWVNSIALMLLSCGIGVQPVLAERLKTIKAEKVGMSSVRLKRLDALNQRYVDAGKLAGVMTMVARHGKIVHFNSAGHMGVNNTKLLAADSLFRIYSMTKPITAVALMSLYEQGAFQLDDPVAKFLPQFAKMKVWKSDHYEDAKSQITMHQLLTHTSGLAYGFHANNPVDARYQQDKLNESKDLQEFVDKLAKIPLLFEPGERWNYSVASDVLGAVAEKITGLSYDEFLRQQIFQPLGMGDTFFNVPADKLSRLTTNHWWHAKNKALVAMDDAAPMNNFTEQTLFSGGGGLVSSMADYMKFAQMLSRGGEFNGHRILSPKTIQYMTQDHLPATIRASGTGELSIRGQGILSKGWGFGLGFGVVSSPVEAAIIGSPGIYFWGGAAATLFWIDPKEDLVVIGMMQLMRSPWPYRNEMMAATYQAITSLNN